MQAIRLEIVRLAHRHWLNRRGLLNRPWFILGSAPSPTIPENISERASLVYVNNAGLGASRLQLPPAHLTISSRHKDWSPVDYQDLPMLLWISNDKRRAYRRWWFNNLKDSSKRRRIRRLDRNLKRAIEFRYVMDDLEEIGEKHKPSTGVVAVLYGLFVGAPRIIIAGISLSRHGYNHGDLPGIQLHQAEDRYTLRKLTANFPSVSTTETDLAIETGLPLFD